MNNVMIAVSIIRNGVAAKGVRYFLTTASFHRFVKHRTILNATSNRYDDDLAFRITSNASSRPYYVRFVINTGIYSYTPSL